MMQTMPKVQQIILAATFIKLPPSPSSAEPSPRTPFSSQAQQPIIPSTSNHSSSSTPLNSKKRSNNSCLRRAIVT